MAHANTETSEGVPRAHPFLKWAGGKSALAPQIERLLPHDWRNRIYREPFLGGGAMFFWLQPELTKRVVLSDTLADLVACYEAVRSSPDALVTRLTALRDAHSTEHFYKVRELFNEQRSAPRLERAAWLVYLNKTCFNGLYRTNKSGAFNVPVGRYTNPGVVNPEALRLASVALADADIRTAKYRYLLDEAEPGDLIYFDPPYVPLSKTSSFASYADGDFSMADQKELADVFRTLDARGCLLALSNSDTPAVRELYADFDLSQVFASRAISATAANRGEVAELVVRNVGRYPARP